MLSELAPGLLDRVRRRRASSGESCHHWLLGTAVPVRCCGERRVLRRLAGLDGSQGTSADNEVAVGATAGASVVRSLGRTGTGTDGLRGSRAA